MALRMCWPSVRMYSADVSITSGLLPTVLAASCSCLTIPPLLLRLNPPLLPFSPLVCACVPGGRILPPILLLLLVLVLLFVTAVVKGINCADATVGVGLDAISFLNSCDRATIWMRCRVSCFTTLSESLPPPLPDFNPGAYARTASTDKSMSRQWRTFRAALKLASPTVMNGMGSRVMVTSVSKYATS